MVNGCNHLLDPAPNSRHPEVIDGLHLNSEAVDMLLVEKVVVISDRVGIQVIGIVNGWWGEFELVQEGTVVLRLSTSLHQIV